MTCPECGAVMREREDRFPDCEDCGFTLYDEDTLTLIAEVQREQLAARYILGEIPTYEEWMSFQSGKYKGDE